VIDPATADLVDRALAEDVGGGDVTAEAVVPAQARAIARIVQKAPGVVFGLEVADEVFRRTGAEALEPIAAEGTWRDDVPADVASVAGPARALLAAERTALNFLCHLSGIATLASRFTAAAAPHGATILDTRKTTPGLRPLEKAAVAAGGARNHRMGLDDAILLKENHVAIAGGVAEAVRRARAARPDLAIEVECRDLDEIAAALEAGAERLLLDNMGPERLREAVALRARAGGRHGRPELEASGGITLGNVVDVAAAGVDYISVGSLTHSAPALDLSLLLEPARQLAGR
jgi:nicotinate-nucleotide pyrophosphorylase (carboxylating)